MASIPTTPKGRSTRNAIIQAAKGVFARAGYVTLRMSDVAGQAGLSIGGLYRYFENKEELFAGVITDLHEELFVASRSTEHDFGRDPEKALLAANRGYLSHYHENREVMRAFIEAATVDERFRAIWWRMRTRHIERFVKALEKTHGITEVDGVPTLTLATAMASMVEQCAYVWYAQESLNPAPVPLEVAAGVVTGVWYRTFFPNMTLGDDGT